jgi:hypothetical protein
MGVGGESHAPVVLPLRKRLVTHYAVGCFSPKANMVGREKCRSPPRFDPRIIQPVASLNTDCAIWAHCWAERVLDLAPTGSSEDGLWNIA